MNKIKNQIIHLIQQKSRRKVAALAGEYVQAKPEEREAIQAGIEIERWLADACEQCLEPSSKC